MTILTAIIIYFFLGIGPAIFAYADTEGDPRFGPGMFPKDKTPYWTIVVITLVLWLPFLIGGLFEKALKE